MPFRDNDEATRERAEALAEEVELLRKERDDLLAEKIAKEAVPEPLPAPATSRDKKRAEKQRRDEQKRRAKQEHRSKEAADALGETEDEASKKRADHRLMLIIATVCVVAVGIPVGLGIRAGRIADRERAAYDAAFAKREAVRKRWSALVYAEPCTRTGAINESYARGSMASGSYKKGRGLVTGRLARNCLSDVTMLAADAASAPRVTRGLGGWLSAEAALEKPAKAFDDYFSHDDWKEDGFAAAVPLWKSLEPLLDARAEAVAGAVRDTLPELREEIRARAQLHEAQYGKVEIVWRVNLGLRLWSIAELALRVALSPRDDGTRATLRAAVMALREAAMEAPIEVRRDLRRLDYTLDAGVSDVAVSQERMFNLANPQPDLLEDLRSSPPALPDLPPKPARRR